MAKAGMFLARVAFTFYSLNSSLADPLCSLPSLSPLLLSSSPLGGFSSKPSVHGWLPQRSLPTWDNDHFHFLISTQGSNCIPPLQSSVPCPVCSSTALGHTKVEAPSEWRPCCSSFTYCSLAAELVIAFIGCSWETASEQHQDRCPGVTRVGSDQSAGFSSLCSRVSVGQAFEIFFWLNFREQHSFINSGLAVLNSSWFHFLVERQE